jgi:hypothetical protein
MSSLLETKAVVTKTTENQSWKFAARETKAFHDRDRDHDPALECFDACNSGLKASLRNKPCMRRSVSVRHKGS